MKVGDLKFSYTDQTKMVIISTISEMIHFWRCSLVLKIYAVLLMKMTAMILVLKINNHATGGWRTKDFLGGPKGWGPKKKVANVEIYVIFEVFAFCGGRSNNPLSLVWFKEGHNDEEY